MKIWALLKKTIRILASGLAVGSILGVVRGAFHVFRNRYIEHNLYYLALDSVQDYALNTAVYFLPVFIATLLLYKVIDRRNDTVEDSRSQFCKLVAVLIFLTVWLYGGYELNKASWYPSFWSASGLISNVLLTVFLAVAALMFLHRVLMLVNFDMLWMVGNRGILFISSILLLIFTAKQTAFHPEEIKSANILLITVDTLRPDHLGCYGYMRDTSPVIDDLAKRGALFQNAVVQWPKTSPSFASMMTSTYGHKNRVMGTRQKLGDFNTTIAEILYNSGFNTVGIVGNANLAAGFNFDQGFKWYQEPWNDSVVEDDNKSGCDATTLTNRAIDWLEEHGDDNNYFLWVHYIDPHAKYIPPPPFDSLFVDDPYYHLGDRKIALNEGQNEDMGGSPGRARLGDIDRLNHYISQYDGEIRYMDEEIGRLMTTVRAIGLWEDLLIIFTSDHGESLGEHNYYFEHGRLPYDACAKVPLIFSGGKIKQPGVRVEEPVAILDLFPTILDYAGLNTIGEEAGITLQPLIEMDTRDLKRNFVFMESGYEMNYQRSIRDTKWKLIYVPEVRIQKIMTGSEYELYDLTSDPGETVNLIDEEQEIAEVMKVELFRWLSETSSMGEAKTGGSTVTVDEETEAHLKALGYVN